jgi:hypothetical protein
VLRMLAVPKMQPTMVHCTHGKDRTGITMALVGRLLGLDDATIIADYHISDAHGSSDEGRATFAHVPELVRCGCPPPRVDCAAMAGCLRPAFSYPAPDFTQSPVYLQDVDHWCRAPHAAMVGLLAYIDTRWGSVQSYCNHIGFDHEWQKRLVAALTDE